MIDHLNCFSIGFASLVRVIFGDRNPLIALVAIAALGTSLFARSASAQVSTWTGAVNDNWFTAGNWDNGLPNSASFTAVVGAPAPTEFNGSVTLGGLNVLAGGVLNVSAGDAISLAPAGALANAGQVNVATGVNVLVNGTVTNTGSITLDGSGAASDIQLTSATSLAGSGTVFLNGASARFNDVLGAATLLTNGVGHTIRGAGNIGVNTIDVVNNGTIRADVAGQTMTVDPQVAFTNNSLLRAENGGVLRLASGAYANTGGSIVSAGGQVQLAGAAITGGLLTGADVFLPSASNTTFTDLTTNATIQVATNVNLVVNGTVTNNGSITLDGSGTASDIQLTSATSFTGSGTVFLNGASARFNDVLGAATLLTNGVGHTIRGAGNIGVNTIDVVNNGTIRADVAGETMTINPQATFTNSGLLRAENGGVIRLSDGAYSSAAGRLEALAAGSRIERTPGAVVSMTFGDVRATGGGVVNVADSSTVDFDLQTNNHTLEFRGQSMTDIFGRSPTGTPLLPHLTSTPGNLGSNQFGLNNGLFIVGDGLNFTSLVAANDFNTGTIIAEEGSTFATGRYSWEPAPCESGSGCPGTSTNILGVHPITSSGTLAGTGTIANMNALNMGIVPGGGAGQTAIFDADFVTNGLISPGNTPLATGTLTLRGDQVILGDTNTFLIEVGEMVNDAVNFVTKTGESVALNGGLSVSLLPGYTPQQGDLFTILTAPQGFTGTIDSEALPVFEELLRWRVNYNATSVVLEIIEAQFLPGDYNRNGVVDAADYTRYRDTLGTNTNLPNDTTPGSVTTADYAVWQANFGASSPSAAAGSAAAVPEPGAIFLVLAGWLLVVGVTIRQSSSRLHFR